MTTSNDTPQNELRKRAAALAGPDREPDAFDLLAAIRGHVPNDAPQKREFFVLGEARYEEYERGEWKCIVNGHTSYADALLCQSHAAARAENAALRVQVNELLPTADAYQHMHTRAVRAEANSEEIARFRAAAEYQLSIARTTLASVRAEVETLTQEIKSRDENLIGHIGTALLQPENIHDDEAYTGECVREIVKHFRAEHDNVCAVVSPLIERARKSQLTNSHVEMQAVCDRLAALDLSRTEDK